MLQHLRDPGIHQRLKRDTSRTLPAWPLRRRWSPFDAGYIPPPSGEFEQVVLYRYGPAQVGLSQSFTSCCRLLAPFKTEPTMPAAHTRGSNAQMQRFQFQFHNIPLSYRISIGRHRYGDRCNCSKKLFRNSHRSGVTPQLWFLQDAMGEKIKDYSGLHDAIFAPVATQQGAIRTPP